ncbi:MAG: CDP-alcohol phosphatidyltransferase family protein [Bacteroidales bacterium]
MRHIPNILTSINLLLGCTALIFVFEGRMHIAAIIIGIAAIFDFADGLAARVLKAYSAIGKDLDSLADLVSFGIVPASVVFIYMLDSKNFPEISSVIWLAAMPAFLITLFSAIRLAIFNNDSRQKESFIGLPTPANAIFFLSLPVVLEYSQSGTPIHYAVELITTDYYNMLILTVLSSALLVSNIPLFSLKFKDFKIKNNLTRYIFLFISLILLVILFVQAIPLIIIFYLILSLINNLF